MRYWFGGWALAKETIIFYLAIFFLGGLEKSGSRSWFSCIYQRKRPIRNSKVLKSLSIDFWRQKLTKTCSGMTWHLKGCWIFPLILTTIRLNSFFVDHTYMNFFFGGGVSLSRFGWRLHFSCFLLHESASEVSGKLHWLTIPNALWAVANGRPGKLPRGEDGQISMGI